MALREKPIELTPTEKLEPKTPLEMRDWAKQILIREVEA
jgi:hypothetical protein